MCIVFVIFPHLGERGRIMSTAELQDFRIYNEYFKAMGSFDVLASKIDVRGGCEKEITKRIGMGENCSEQIN